jgi:hypothetical protein
MAYPRTLVFLECTCLVVMSFRIFEILVSLRY